MRAFLAALLLLLPLPARSAERGPVAPSAPRKARKAEPKKASAPAPKKAPAPKPPTKTEMQSGAMLKAMEGLASRQKAADPIEQRALERMLENFGPEFVKLGSRAVAPLSAYLGDRSRPRKVRLYAAAFLGLLGDPGGLDALKSRLGDEREDPGLRGAALQAAGSLRLSAPAKRALAEFYAFDPGAPEPVLNEAAAILAETGSDEVEALSRLAKLNGPAPKGAKAILGHSALSALMSSKRPSEEALLSLVRFFNKGTSLRADAVAALRARKPKASDIPREGVDLLSTLLNEERGRAALDAARLLGELGDPRAAAPLIRALKAKDPALLAEAAEALAKLGDPSAAKPLAKLEEGLISDARFAPRGGGDDPRPFAVRIQKAAAFFAKALRREAERKPVREPLFEKRPEEAFAPLEEPREPDPSEAPSFAGAPGPAAAGMISTDETPQRTAKAPAAPPKAAPPAPVEKPSRTLFRYEGWPVAEKPRPVWSGRSKALVLRAQPSASAPVVADGALAEGRPLPVADSVVLTRETGLLRALAPCSYELRDVAPDPGDKPLPRSAYEGLSLRRRFEFREGEGLEVLAYRPLGGCLFRRAGRILTGECLTQESEKRFKLVREPKTEWWLKTELSGASGWFSSEDEGVDFAP